MNFKMISLVASLFCLTLASSSVISKIQNIPILKQVIDVDFDGNYHNSFETGNGILLNEHGLLKNPGTQDHEAAEVSGYVSYTAPDGTPINLRYIANENGFIAEGAHLPVAPPIPPAILRALKWMAAHPRPVDSVNE